MKEKGFCLLLLSSGSQVKHGPVSPEQARHRGTGKGDPTILRSPFPSRLNLCCTSLTVICYHTAEGLGWGSSHRCGGPSSAPMLRKTEGYTSVMEPQFNSGLLKSCMEHCAQICFETRKDGPGMKGGPSFPPTEVKRGHSDRSCLARMESHSKRANTKTKLGGNGALESPTPTPPHTKSSPHPHSALTLTAH